MYTPQQTKPPSSSTVRPPPPHKQGGGEKTCDDEDCTAGSGSGEITEDTTATSTNSISVTGSLYLNIIDLGVGYNSVGVLLLDRYCGLYFVPSS